MLKNRYKELDCFLGIAVTCFVECICLGILLATTLL